MNSGKKQRSLKRGPWVKVRRASQAVFLLLFLALLWFLPPLARIFFASSPHLSIPAAVAGRSFTAALVPAVFIIITSAILGRYFCGWICPAGTMIDIAGAVRKKLIPSGREFSPVRLKYLKYVLLASALAFAAAGIQAAWMLDPITVSGRFVSLILIPQARILFPASGSAARYAGSSWFLLSFAVLILLTLFSRRFWCRSLCPLGGFLALASKLSPLKRRVDRGLCPGSCSHCTKVCRTGAINNDISYEKIECILCMDCIYMCPGRSTVFSFSKKKRKNKKPDSSRRNFLIAAALGLSAAAAGWKNKVNPSGKNKGKEIRPPGALKDSVFFAMCLRCGNCFSACPTNGLQADMNISSPASLWTPRLVPEIGECRYGCNRCGRVCPTGAIPSLTIGVKQNTRLGTASIDTSKCLPWTGRGQCLACRRSCPVPGPAIGLQRKEGHRFDLPAVIMDLCIGCGACQNVCPVRPDRAIKVDPSTARRT